MKAKISSQLKALGAWLASETEGSGAKVMAVPNQRKLWQAIFEFETRSSPLILICFDGETARGGFNERNLLDRVDRQWVVVILQGIGFKRTKNEEIPSAGLMSETSFYDDCESVRDLCRRLVGISGEVIDYVSMKPLPGVAQPNAANNFLDGYVVTFTTANDIPAITMIAPEQE